MREKLQSSSPAVEPDLEKQADKPATETIVPLSPKQAEELDADEAELRALRHDVPGVKGAGAAGIVTISVNKIPTKNEYFRSHLKIRPVISIVNVEVGMENQYFAVTKEMVDALRDIGISVANHMLYLTLTSQGALRICPVRQASDEEHQNEYDRTREIGLVDAMHKWVRLYHDEANRCYKVFPAPAGRFSEPQWPDLKEGKIIRLAFRDKGRLIDSIEHPLFKKWAGRDSK
jgi:hypothetical protein